MKLPKNLYIPGCGLFIALCTISWPIETTLAWHLRYGSHIKGGGRTFDVPWRWTASIEGRTVRFVRLPYTAISDQSTTTAIFLWPVASPPKSEAEKEATYHSFANVYWTYLAGNSSTVLKGPERSGEGEKELVCMEARPDSQSHRITISCMAFQGTWVSSLYGNEDAVDTFHAIIENSK